MRRFFKAKTSQKAWIISGLFVLGLVCASAPVSAQSSRDVNNRLNRIENEIQTLSRTVYRGEAPSGGVNMPTDPAASADAQVRLQQLEMELRNIRGKIEEQDFEIRQMRNDLDRSLSDMQLRLDDLEGGNRSGSVAPIAGGSRYSANSAANTAPSSGGGEPTTSEGSFQWNSNQGANTSGQLGTLTQSGGNVSANTDSAAAAYENAFALLKNGQYDAAEREFSAFLSANPNHVLASNAKYWLGETYYVRGNFDEAARIFAEGYKQYPKGSKAPDNLLKLGLSLAGLGSTSDACIALGQLNKEYPTGSLPVLRRAEQEMARLNCV